MHDLDVLHRLNAEACGKGEALPAYSLRLHPQICALRREVDSLPVSAEYHRRLRHALWRHAGQLVGREDPPPEGGWSNLEALQQLALADGIEASLRSMSCCTASAHR